MKLSSIFAIVALLSVVPAMAATQSTTLTPPPDSQQAWGLAKIRYNGQGVDVFQVRADIRVPDGTELVVAIELEDRDGIRDWYDVAIMHVQLGTAYMVLDSREDVSPAFPVSAILGVRVRRNKNTALAGTFEKTPNAAKN